MCIYRDVEDENEYFIFLDPGESYTKHLHLERYYNLGAFGTYTISGNKCRDFDEEEEAVPLQTHLGLEKGRVVSHSGENWYFGGKEKMQGCFHRIQ